MHYSILSQLHNFGEAFWHFHGFDNVPYFYFIVLKELINAIDTTQDQFKLALMYCLKGELAEVQV